MGVSFTHKTNPADEAKAPKGRIWRKANDRRTFVECSKRLKKVAPVFGCKMGTQAKIVQRLEWR